MHTYTNGRIRVAVESLSMTGERQSSMGNDAVLLGASCTRTPQSPHPCWLVYLGSLDHPRPNCAIPSRFASLVASPRIPNHLAALRIEAPELHRTPSRPLLPARARTDGSRETKGNPLLPRCLPLYVSNERGANLSKNRLGQEHPAHRVRFA